MGADAVVNLLGGRRAIGHGVASSIDFDAAIREGFRWTALQHLKSELQLTNQLIARLTGASEKTVERWFKRRDRITPSASNVLYRVATIVALAEEVLNDAGQARDWLNASQHGLGGRRPIDLLATNAGAQEVEELLKRMQYGFYA
jgi:putative toxin-antitoxin system antitoxin component (TIGR02293 family)